MDLSRRRRRVLRHPRPVRGRARRPRSRASPACVDIDAGDGHHRRARHDRGGAVPPQRRDGVRELRALPAEDGVREPGVAAAVRPDGPVHRGSSRSSGSTPSPPRWASTTCCSASPGSCPTASASASRWAGCWSVPPTSTCSTSRCRTWTPSCAPRCAPSSSSSGRMSSTTALYVTHDYQEALALGDRIAVLRQGGLVQVGTPEEIWRDRPTRSSPRRSGSRRSTCSTSRWPTGALRGAGGAVSVPRARGTWTCPGDRVRLGMRPRDLRARARRGRGTPSLRGPGVTWPSASAASSSSASTSARDTEHVIVVADQRRRRPRGRLGRPAPVPGRTSTSSPPAPAADADGLGVRLRRSATPTERVSRREQRVGRRPDAPRALVLDGLRKTLREPAGGSRSRPSRAWT